MLIFSSSEQLSSWSFGPLNLASFLWKEGKKKKEVVQIRLCVFPVNGLGSLGLISAELIETKLRLHLPRLGVSMLCVNQRSD